ncbi:Acetyltransferase (GNAT) family protein [Calidithermus terrae]|uniref:Acetyltransferase (GNAT) family protein n=1 Tax=Calidithermus terrae TaxID=1408545 RepID=A0A399EHU1_9DEIN|nr:GNAT family N-acetyltransferase [Calidithermus terrae]RIH83063.1 Acetyltransferase (GNAT) family protein [Calidithermus terrae]
MDLIIRPFTPEDHPPALEIHNAIWPDTPQTLEDRLEADGRRRADLVFRRYAAEVGGQVVATGSFQHMEWFFHPRKFALGMEVHPQWQGQGVGGRLWRHLLAELEAFEPLSLHASVREDKNGWAVARHYGFAEESRAWESLLDLSAFDPAPFGDAVERVRAAGYRILSWAELGDTPEHRRRLWELDVEVSEDVPHTHPFTMPTLERYEQRVFGSRDFQPETLLVALSPDGEFAGVSQLWKTRPEHRLDNGLTGVRRAHRRKGLALAMKLENVARARALGKREIRTFNDQTNRPMLAINEAMGFVKQPAWIDVVRVLRSE